MPTPPSLFHMHAPDAEMLVAAWLAPVRRSGVAFRTGDPLPFTLVTRIGGDENFWIREDEPLVSVHTLCDVSLGYAAAAEEAQMTHDRMLELAWTLGPVTMPDGSLVCVEYLKPFQYPVWRDYEDVTILRKVGRYKMGLPYLWNDVA
jgi:hypothetical protein